MWQKPSLPRTTRMNLNDLTLSVEAWESTLMTDGAVPEESTTRIEWLYFLVCGTVSVIERTLIRVLQSRVSHTD